MILISGFVRGRVQRIHGCDNVVLPGNQTVTEKTNINL
jgi:hypothetical protein